jgi:TPR repeat protein
LPISAFLYPFIGKKQTIESKNDNSEWMVLIIMFLAVFPATFIFSYIKQYFELQDSEHFGFIGSSVIIGILTFFIAIIFAFVGGAFSGMLSNERYKKKIKQGLIGIFITTILMSVGYKMYESFALNDTKFERAVTLYEQGNYKEAFDIFNSLEKSLPKSKYYLGAMYYLGQGVGQNYLIAQKYLTESLPHSNDAQFLLGNMYFSGNGVPQDYQKAYEFYEAAYNNGNKYATLELAYMNYLGIGTPVNYDKSFALYKSIDDNPIAQNMLGNMIFKGLGTEQNINMAIYWYEKSAANNYKEGLYNLAGAYYQGIGVEQNYKKAFDLYTKSSQFGKMEAKIMIANMYISGQGITKNIVLGKKILIELSENNPKAKEILDNLQKNGI